MIYSLKNISDTKRSIIMEALRLWKRKQDESIGSRRFLKIVDEYGWENDGCGAFKRCIIKGSIVAKYPLTSRCKEDRLWNESEVRREFEQWKYAPKLLKKYLPRCYAFIDNLLIQDKVINTGFDSKRRKELNKLIREFDLRDAEPHNVGFSRLGTIKFFDWVYKRRDEAVCDIRGDKSLKDY